jgi:plasmid replication initiation protein
MMVMEGIIVDSIEEAATGAKKELAELRGHMAVKPNDIIQKSRFQLSLQEQKIILYLISKIKPKDMHLKEHVFEIADFCNVCGIDAGSGTNYKNIKQTLKSLRDRSVWITLDDGSETTLAWIDKITISHCSGAVSIKIDEMMKPYLLQLQDNYTQYELLYILAMRSQYSIRLYELLRSCEYQKKSKTIDIDELKRRLSAENYIRYPDFKRCVLDVAMRGINSYSDIAVTYEPLKECRRYAAIKFKFAVKKHMDDRIETWARIDDAICAKQGSLEGKTGAAKA